MGLDELLVDKRHSERIRTVVVIPNLLFILALRVHHNFRDHFEEDILEELGGHDELGPVMASLENFQNVTCVQSGGSIS